MDKLSLIRLLIKSVCTNIYEDAEFSFIKRYFLRDIFFQHLIYDTGTLYKEKTYMWMMEIAYKTGQAPILLLLHLLLQ